MMNARLFFSLSAAVLLAAAAGSPSAAEQQQTVIRSGSAATAAADSSHFTGRAFADAGFRQEAPARAYGAWVTFEPGARTHWHIHPLGQTLVVTFGTGLTQSEGGAAEVIRAGDVVVCPPGVKHWHGAAAGTMMQHFAVGERDPSAAVTWLEPVSDEDYLKANQAIAK